jgi:hypothetical protein
MKFIMDWKVAGAFVSPKNITIGSNKPQFVLKAAFHWSPSRMRMLLYPHQISSFVKSADLRPCTLVSRFISSRISGSGAVFHTVKALSLR